MMMMAMPVMMLLMVKLYLQLMIAWAESAIEGNRSPAAIWNLQVNTFSNIPLASIGGRASRKKEYIVCFCKTGFSRDTDWDCSPISQSRKCSLSPTRSTIGGDVLVHLRHCDVRRWWQYFLWEWWWWWWHCCWWCWWCWSPSRKDSFSPRHSSNPILQATHHPPQFQTALDLLFWKIIIGLIDWIYHHDCIYHRYTRVNIKVSRPFSVLVFMLHFDDDNCGDLVPPR